MQSIVRHMPKLKAAAYLALSLTLFVAPKYADQAHIHSAGGYTALSFLSGVFSAICGVKGCAYLGFIRQPTWLWDEIVLPLAFVWAVSVMTI